MTVNYIHSKRLDELIYSLKIENNDAISNIFAILSDLEDIADRKIKISHINVETDSKGFTMWPEGELIQYGFSNGIRGRLDDYTFTFKDKFTKEIKSLKINLQEIGLINNPTKSSYIYTFLDENNQFHLIVFNRDLRPSMVYNGQITNCTNNCKKGSLTDWCKTCNGNPLDNIDLMYQISHINEPTSEAIVALVPYLLKNQATIKIYKNIKQLEVISVEKYMEIFTYKFDKISDIQRTLKDNAIKFLEEHPDMKTWNDNPNKEFHNGWAQFDEVHNYLSKIQEFYNKKEQ